MGELQTEVTALREETLKLKAQAVEQKQAIRGSHIHNTENIMSARMDRMHSAGKALHNDDMALRREVTRLETALAQATQRLSEAESKLARYECS